MRETLLDFHRLYVRYLEATNGQGAQTPDALALRTELLARVAPAQRALDETNINPVIYAPPMLPGPTLRGLPNTLFAHESRYAGVAGNDVVQLVQQALVTGASYLEAKAREEQRRRQRWWYWPDRVITFLGIPVYLLSRLFGVPQRRIEESPFAAALRIAGLILEALGVFFGGRSAGWW
jgi:hypothetical protein